MGKQRTAKRVMKGWVDLLLSLTNIISYDII